jgi:hypothetical protein
VGNVGAESEARGADMSPDPITSAATGAVVKVAEETAKATSNLVQKILGPPSEEVGDHLRLLVRTKLAAWRGRLLTANEAAELAVEAASRRLRNVPSEQIQSPAPEVLAGVVEGLQTRADVPELREMFANLLAAAMDASRAAEAHPAYTEIIRQIVADEARLFEYFVSRFAVALRQELPTEVGDNVTVVGRTRARLVHLAEKAGCDRPSLASEYVQNLTRLGLIGERRSKGAEIKGPGAVIDVRIKPTDFGRAFAAACLPYDSPAAAPPPGSR